LKAFEKLSINNQEIKLVIVGSEGWKNQAFQNHLKLSNVKEKVIITGRVQREELWSIYQNASLFVFASDFEGFGIPVKEAMFHHLPILLSDAESLAHFDDKKIVRFNRFDAPELAQKMSEIVKRNEGIVVYQQRENKKLSIALLEE